MREGEAAAIFGGQGLSFARPIFFLIFTGLGSILSHHHR